MAEIHGGFFRQAEQIAEKTARDQALAQLVSPTETEIGKAVVVSDPVAPQAAVEAPAVVPETSPTPPATP